MPRAHGPCALARLVVHCRPPAGVPALVSAMAASVLVVSNPEDRDAILDPLRKAGVSDLLARDGSDDTLALCARARPDVVIVSARLEQGDARAFISAMREMDPSGQGGQGWSPRVILIGELDGPLRTPLDVSDLHVDHFLVQPLSPKALVFATRAAMAAATTSAGTRGGPETKPKTKIDTKPKTKIDTKPKTKIDTKTEAKTDAKLGAKTDARFETRPAPEAAARSAGAASEPAPAWRARTEILPDGAASPAGPAPAAGKAEDGHRGPDPDAEAEWQQSMEPAGASFVGPIVVSSVVHELTPLPAPVPFIDEEADDDLDDYDLQIEVDIGAELEADLAQPLARPAPAASKAVRPAAAPQAGDGTFASELQRKMSAMEERLLAREARVPAAPGAAPGAVPADVPAAVPTEVSAEVLAETMPAEVPAEIIDAVSEAVPRSEPSARIATRPEAADPAPGAAGGRAAAAPAHPDEPGQGILRRGHGDFASLLERMYRERFTGRVLLRRRHAEKTIVFQHGRPVFATSNQPEDRLGALLARAGKITDEQAELSHRRALDTGKRMGEVLVENGFLKRRELLPAVRLQLEEILYSLFAWDQGEYTVAPGEPSPGERIRLSAHPAAMVLEGVRRKYSRDVLVDIVGPPESALEIIDPTQRDTLMNVADLAPAERDIALAFDGARTLAEIADRSRMGRLVVYQLAYGLIAFGAARVRRPGDAPAADADHGAWHGPDGDGDGEADLGIDRKRIQAKHALVDEADYFAILGVRRDATGFEIQRAYEAACRDYAPAEVSPALRHELERELAEIREVLDEAYQVLRDDGLRSSYLTHLRD
jgi:DNA-binding NarL/FixJ family response regulator